MQTKKFTSTLARGLASAAIALQFGAASAQTTVSVPQDTRVRTTTYTYVPATGQLLTQVTEPDADPSQKLTQTYQYTSQGARKLATATGWDGANVVNRTATTNWDAASRFPQSTLDAYNHETDVTYDARFGLPTLHVDPNGIATRWDYDAFGRKLHERRGYADKTTTTFTDQTQWTYGPLDSSESLPSIDSVASTSYVTEQEFSSTGAAIGPAKTTYFDARGRVLRVATQVLKAGTSGNVMDTSYVDTDYKTNGEVDRVSAPYLASGKETAVWTNYTAYDALRRNTSQTAPNGIRTDVRFTALSTTTTVHATEGDRTRTVKTDAAGRNRQIVDALGHSAYYIFDAQDDLTHTIDSYGNVVQQGYDLRGRRNALVDPDMGTWSYGYNAFGEQVSEVDAKQQHTTSTYDLLGRLTYRSEPDLNSTFVYDTAAKGVGRLAQSSADNGYCRTMTFDSLGRPWQTTATYGAPTLCAAAGTGSIASATQPTFTTTTTYDSAGRVDTVSYPTGVALRYGYDTLIGQPVNIQDMTGGHGGKVYWRWQDGDAQGRTLQFTYANGLGTVKTYDPTTKWLSGIVGGSGVAQLSSYVYDSVGNLSQRSDKFDIPNLVEHVDHDAIGRLTTYALFDPTGANEQAGSRVNLVYDAIGDIVSKSDVGTYYYDASGANSVRPHAVAEVRGAVNASYAYADANGNQTGGASRTWTYTSSNLVASVGNVNTCHRITYEGERLRTSDAIYNVSCAGAPYATPTDMTLYMHPDAANGLSFERETRGASVNFRHYITVGGMVVGEIVTTAASPSSGTTRYFHYDHLGSVVAVSDDGGNVIERRSFDAWGRPRATTGAAGTGELPNGLDEATDRGFTLSEHLEGLGLIHMNGRVYDPTIARFASPDPNVTHADDLQSFNRFAYVENRPLDSVDPTGFTDTPSSANQTPQTNSTVNLDGSLSSAARPSLAVGSGGSSAYVNSTTPAGLPPYQQQSGVGAPAAGAGAADPRAGLSWSERLLVDAPQPSAGGSQFVAGFGSSVSSGATDLQNATAQDTVPYYAGAMVGVIPGFFTGSDEVNATRLVVKEADGIWQASKLGAAKMEHIFSADHVREGIMDLGKSKTEILNQARDALMAANKPGGLREGMNTVITKINGYDATVRAFIKNGEMQSMNLFKGLSDRVGQYVIDLR